MDNHSHPEIIQMQVQIGALAGKVDHLEKILVTGSDEQLPLPEIVRALATTVDNYIKRKEQEEKDKKEEWGKWKWAILGVVIPGVTIFLVQAAFFFFRFVPIMLQMSTVP